MNRLFISLNRIIRASHIHYINLRHLFYSTFSELLLSITTINYHDCLCKAYLLSRLLWEFYVGSSENYSFRVLIISSGFLQFSLSTLHRILEALLSYRRHHMSFSDCYGNFILLLWPLMESLFGYGHLSRTILSYLEISDTSTTSSLQNYY